MSWRSVEGQVPSSLSDGVRRRGGRGLVLAFFVGWLGACSSSSDPTPPVDDPPPAVRSLQVREGAFVDTVSWARPQVDDFAAYRVERSRRGVLAGVIPDTTRYELGFLPSVSDTVWIDEDVSPGHLYEYAVRIEDAAGQLGPYAELSVRTRPPEVLAVGLEPRRSSPEPGEVIELDLWVAGVVDLQGVILELAHALPRLGCAVASPFGDPTLWICTGPAAGPTELAVSGVRGGPMITGIANIARLRLGPALGASPDSITLTVLSLAGEDGGEIPGADAPRLRSSYLDVAR